MALQTSFTFRFADIEVHEPELRVIRSGEPLALEPKAFRVLIHLLRHAGRLVPKEELISAVWGDTAVTDSSLTRAIALLRKSLDDDPHNPRYIETVSTAGYRFICPVETESGETAASSAGSPGLTEGKVGKPRISEQRARKKRWIALAALGLGLAGAAGLAWYAFRPLPAPYISHYEQLTLDGKRKNVRGTDGTSIYMNLFGSPGGIVRIPVSGGKMTEFRTDVPGGDASRTRLIDVSPDGTSLLVRNGWKVWVVGALGHPARYLTTAFSAAWSPDGKAVVYSNLHGDIYTISVSGGEPRLLHRENAPAHQNPQVGVVGWSPDGASIRIATWNGKIFEMSSSGTNLHEWLPGWNGSVQKCCGKWTPDGQFFVFLARSRSRKGPYFPPLAQIWAVDERRGKLHTHDSEPTLLASDPLFWGPPVPSRDGKKIFASGVSLRGQLERYDQTSKRLEPYLGGISAEMPDFSRDGKYVAYISFPDGILWRANRDASGLTQLTQPPFYPRNPRWSPDGTEIMFVDNTADGVDALYTISAQGGTPKRLLPDDGGPQSLGDWSPDGKRVVYTNGPQFSFLPWDLSKVETRIVELATGKVAILPKGPEGFFAPLWSPDGRYIAGQSSNARELAIFDIKRGNGKTFFEGRARGTTGLGTTSAAITGHTIADSFTSFPGFRKRAGCIGSRFRVAKRNSFSSFPRVFAAQAGTTTG